MFFLLGIFASLRPPFVNSDAASSEPRGHGARVTLQVQEAKAKLTAHGIEMEAGIRKTAVEQVQPRTLLELEGRRSLVELKGFRADVQPVAKNHMVEPGYSLTKAMMGGRGSLVEPGGAGGMMSDSGAEGALGQG